MTQDPPPRARRRETLGLVLLFAVMYFVQGIAEPTEGLIAQPVRSLLSSWDYSDLAIGGFMALLAIPWVLKPLYGLLTDFVPIFGQRRKSYLILTSLASTVGLFVLYLFPLPAGTYHLLLFLLVLPTLGVAFSDVVVDALMIEKGQPRNLTGTLQSVQWSAMYAGSLIAGVLGGWLSQHGRQQQGFLMCAVASSLTLALAMLFVREDAVEPPPGRRFRSALKEMGAAARTPTLILAAGFLFLWSFNPFNTTVLQLHMTRHVNITQYDYGVSVSMLSLGAILGSLAYGLYCRRVSMHWLIHLAIFTGILSTLAYWDIRESKHLWLVSVFVGLTYQTGSMIQYDLAARTCPVHAAGTTFALLMAISNLSMSLSIAVGSWFYDDWSDRWGRTAAFRGLVVLGCVSTAFCWVLLPFIDKALKSVSADHSETPPVP